MTAAEASVPVREASWYGWVLAFAFVLAPVAGWVGPLAFAPIAGLSGLLSLGALRMAERDRPAALAILVLSIWALVSMLWSPFHPTKAGQATAMKLVLQGVLYWALFRAAAALPAASRAPVLRIFAWGMALLGALLAVEALTGAGVYQALRNAMNDPIRPDLAVKNVAQGGFVLAVLTPAAALAGWRAGAGVWPGLLMVAGVLGASFGLDADAPVIALVLSTLAVGAVWRWPVWAPRVVAGAAAVLFLAAPAVVWITRQLGWFQALEREVPLSWSLRMGYWRHAADWIGDHPLRGWGIDASRMFGPGITLHPHNGPLQVWLELGLIGATAAAVFWFVTIASQSQPRRDVGRGVAVGTAVAYLTFSAVSFGVWQEWWLAVGGLAAAGCMAVLRQGRAENA
ncbi:MAG: O-antigen ligase family protein [Phenylobacterium sp.]|nr:O-antigen ligase family protein [Phenylobacterium sp.]